MALEISYCRQGKAPCIRGIIPTSLKISAEKRDSARQRLGSGIDPGHARKAEKISQADAQSFEVIAREWYAKFFARLAVESYRDQCDTIGRYVYLFKRLTAVLTARFYRFEHMVSYSSGKVIAKSTRPPVRGIKE